MSRVLNLNTILVLIVAVLLVVALAGLKRSGAGALHQVEQTGQCVIDALVGGCR